MSDTRKPRYAEVTAVALILRVIVALLVLHSHGAHWFYAQATELGRLAASVNAGQGLESPFGGATGPSAFLAPGYPVLVAAIFHLFGSYGSFSALVLMMMQALFGAVTVGTLMVLASRLFGAAVANLAGLVWAVSLPLLWLPSIFWETSLSILLCTLLLVCASYIAAQPGLLFWTVYGALGGITLMTNPSLLSVVVCCAIWATFRTRPSGIWGPFTGFIVCAGLCIPWTIRNETQFHAFIPLRSNASYELWQGNRPGGDGFFDPTLHLNVNREEFSSYERLGEIAYMREKGQIAMAEIHSQPGIFLMLTFRRIICFWTGLGRGPSALMTCYICLTSAAGFAGLVLLRKRSLGFALLAMPTLFFPLPYYVTHPDYRFRLIIDPVMAILSAYLATELRRRRSSARLS